jgi:hypothetical protein
MKSSNSKQVNIRVLFFSFLSMSLLTALLFSQSALAYPLDGYKDTGIRRVEGARLANQGKVKDYLKQVPGAMLTTEQVDIRLLD